MGMVVCSKCDGKGYTEESIKGVSVEVYCRRCNGTGEIWDDVKVDGKPAEEKPHDVR